MVWYFFIFIAWHAPGPPVPLPSLDFAAAAAGDHREGHLSKLSVHAVDAVAKHDACACHHVAQMQDTSGAGHYIGGQCGGASPLSRRSSVIF